MSIQIVKTFDNIVDALVYAEKVKKNKKVIGEPIVYAKYIRHVCNAKVVFNVK